jgi:MFS family permease
VTLITAYLSDRYQARGLVTIFCSILATVGFAMFLGSHSTKVQYGSLFVSITGVYCSAPATSTWSANNAAPHTRRATAIAIGFIMTNSGGILSTWLLGSLSKGPRYTKGTIVLLIFSILMVFFAAGNIVYLTHQNKKKAQRRKELGRRENEEKGLGDGSAWFIYSL